MSLEAKIEALTAAVEANTAFLKAMTGKAAAATTKAPAEKEEKGEKPAANKAAADKPKRTAKGPSVEEVAKGYGDLVNSFETKKERNRLTREILVPIAEHFGAEKISLISKDQAAEAASFLKLLQEAGDDIDEVCAVKLPFMQDDGDGDGDEEDEEDDSDGIV